MTPRLLGLLVALDRDDPRLGVGARAAPAPAGTASAIFAVGRPPFLGLGAGAAAAIAAENESYRKRADAEKEKLLDWKKKAQEKKADDQDRPVRPSDMDVSRTRDGKALQMSLVLDHTQVRRMFMD